MPRFFSKKGKSHPITPRKLSASDKRSGAENVRRKALVKQHQTPKYPQVGDMRMVQDLQQRPDLELVTVDFEVKSILDSIGKEDADYGSLLVNAGSGEYTEVWGIRSSIPFLDAPAELLHYG